MLEDEGLAAKVLRQLGQAVQPALHDVEVQWTFANAAATAAAQSAPVGTPPMHARERFTSYVLAPEPPVGVTVRARLPGAAQTTQLLQADLRAAPAVAGMAVHTLAARTLVQDLEDSYHERDPERQQAEALILELGLRYQLMTSRTSFVAAEPRPPPGLSELDRHLASVRQMMLTNIDQILVRSECLDQLATQSETLACSSRTFAKRNVSLWDRMCSTVSSWLPATSRRQPEREASPASASSPPPPAASLPPPSPPSPPKPATTTAMLLEFVSLQRHDGQFALDQSLAGALGLSLDALTKAMPASAASPAAWATALALAHLSRRFAARQDEWRLVAAKAQAWLATGPASDAVLAAARALLSP